MRRFDGCCSPGVSQLHRRHKDQQSRGTKEQRAEGRIGAILGEETVYGGPGDLIFKPRDQWHTFWNAGETDARILEIISPAGFERYFEELVELFLPGRPAPEVLREVAQRYGLETDPTSIPRLVEEHGLVTG